MFQQHYETQLDRLKESFLLAASKGGRIQEVASLLEMGAQVDWKQNKSTNTRKGSCIDVQEETVEDNDSPLFASIRNGHADVASLLLAHGANPYQKDSKGNSALHIAAMSGNEEVCFLLLNLLPDDSNLDTYSSQNDSGLTPIDIAMDRGHTALGEKLKMALAGSAILINDDFDNYRQRYQGNSTKIHDLPSTVNESMISDLNDSYSLSVSAPSTDEDDYSTKSLNGSNQKSLINKTFVEDEMTFDRSLYSLSHKDQIELLRDLVQKLQTKNNSLEKMEKATRIMSVNTENALLVLEKKCARLENELEDKMKTLSQLLDGSHLNHMTLEQIETVETRLKKSLHHVAEHKEKLIRNMLSEEEEKRTCVICQVETKSVLLMPCRHLCVCKECSSSTALRRCPLCRQDVSQKIDVFS